MVTIPPVHRFSLACFRLSQFAFNLYPCGPSNSGNMARPSPRTPPPSPNENVAFRESILLPDPPTFAVSEIEADKWGRLKNEALSSAIQHTFARLLIILVCIFCANVKHKWVKHWRHSFSPLYVHRTVRYAILNSILQLARSPDAKPDLELEDPIEGWQAFLRPILPQNHPCFGSRSIHVFQSSNIRQVASILDRQGYGFDMASILELNGRLRRILSPDLIAVPDISLPLSLSPETHLLRRCQELQAFLGPGIEDDCMTVIAYSRCGWGSAYLQHWFQHWSGTLEAAWLVDSLLRKIEETANRPLQLLSQLVAANLIYHQLLEKGNATHEGSRLPWGLSQWELYLIPEGLVSCARYFGLHSELQQIAPPSLLLTFELSQDVAKQWEELWRQRFPPHWRLHLPVSGRDPDKEVTTENLKNFRQSETSHRSRWSGRVGWVWNALCPGSTDT